MKFRKKLQVSLPDVPFLFKNFEFIHNTSSKEYRQQLGLYSYFC